MSEKNSALLDKVSDYYTKRIIEYGATAKGVDWNNEDDQQLRFKELMKIADGEDKYSLNDLGCGYGALLTHLEFDQRLVKYHGIDVSQSMIDKAKSIHQPCKKADFIVSDHLVTKTDFAVASGIFNVKLSNSDASWKSYILQTLDILNEYSDRGFAFNALTSYADEERKEARLFYANPCELFDLCKRRYARNVSLVHDYGLYEFTMLVKK